MYGLASRDSLSKRQSRWIRDVDDSIHNNPPINSLIQNSSINIPSERNNTIITPTHSHDTDSNISLSPRNNSSLRKNILNFNDDLKDQISILSQKYSNLKDKIKGLHDNFSLRLNNIETQQITFNSNLSSLLHKINKLENSLVQDNQTTSASQLYSNNQTTSESQLYSNNQTTSASQLYSNNQTTSQLYSDNQTTSASQLYSDYREFIPFFIREEYSGIDNITILNKTNMEMTVDIVGLFNDSPIIYPFGLSKDLPDFIDLNIYMNFEDTEKTINGVMYGNFTKGEKGIYIIEITELYCDGVLLDINNITLPITITCNTDLILNP